jgi:FkbM family methyltransferase
MKIILLIKDFIRKNRDNFVIFLAKITKTNLTVIGYYQKGISIYGDAETTGEKFVIDEIIYKKIKNKTPIFFDVGANTGSYSLYLKKVFPQSVIYAFEPNLNTYKNIKKEALNEKIKFYNIGLRSSSGLGLIYDYKDKIGSEHASVYKQVFTDLHHTDNIEEIKFTSDTLDNFCFLNKINQIDFLKIDTEGSEYDILLGSTKMLVEKKINIIQFEFNEMNIISRVFLKDYYELLCDYNIYRITPKKLIPLIDYKTENEIFKYQNFLAIHKSFE